jgi:hypothetical protein
MYLLLQPNNIKNHIVIGVNSLIKRLEIAEIPIVFGDWVVHKYFSDQMLYLTAKKSNGGSLLAAL